MGDGNVKKNGTFKLLSESGGYSPPFFSISVTVVMQWVDGD